VEAVSAGVVEGGSRAFDRRFASANRQLQAEVQLGRPGGFEVVGGLP
jgi:protein involved in ribonucleotide reduction